MDTPYVPLANTTNATTIRELRIKLNDAIAVINHVSEDTHTNLVSNTDFQAFVANTNAYIAATAGVGEVSNSYLTSSYVSNTTFQSALANTNSYIAAVSAASSPSSETVDYGFITSAVDLNIARDYGTL